MRLHVKVPTREREARAKLDSEESSGCRKVLSGDYQIRSL